MKKDKRSKKDLKKKYGDVLSYFSTNLPAVEGSSKKR